MDIENDYDWNAFAGPTYYLSNGIGVRSLVVRNEIPHRPKLIIVIEDTTKKYHIIKELDNILAAREATTQIVGSDLNNNYDNVLLEIQGLRDQNVTWGDILKILNYRCLGLVCLAYDRGENFEDPNEWGSALSILSFMFEGLRFSESYLEQELIDVHEQLENGRNPWILGSSPFNITKVRNNLNYFLDRIRMGELIIKPRPDNPSADFMTDLLLLRDGGYEKANQLLQKDPVYWKKISKWITRRHAEIKRELRNSTSPALEEARLWLENGSNIAIPPHT